MKRIILSCVVASLSCPLVLASPKPPKHRISMEHAEKIATQVQKGTVEGKELEHEHGKWIYSFDIRGADKKIHEVHVDPRNGRVLSQTVETPQQEASEAASESKSH